MENNQNDLSNMSTANLLALLAGKMWAEHLLYEFGNTIGNWKPKHPPIKDDQGGTFALEVDRENLLIVKAVNDMHIRLINEKEVIQGVLESRIVSRWNMDLGMLSIRAEVDSYDKRVHYSIEFKE